MEIRERVNNTKAAHKITNKMLSEASGLCMSTIIYQCGGKYDVSLELVTGLLKLVPSLDARWLITGESNEDRITVLENEIKDIRSLLDKLSPTTTWIK